MGRVGWSVGLGVSLLFVVYALIGVEAGTERASGSSGKSSTPPVPQPVTMTMDTIDYIRSGALVVAFLATNFAGRDTWILTDLIVTFSFGAAWYFFPDALFSYQVDGKPDVVHIYFCQLFGAMLLSSAVTLYASRESRDRSVTGSWLLSRVLGCAVLLQAMALDHMKAKNDPKHWNQQHVTFGMLGCALWLLGSLWQYLRSPSYGSGGVDLKKRLTKHLLVDIIIILPISLGMFAFPDILLAYYNPKVFTPDGIHAHLIRAIGALTFMSTLHGHSAMGFIDDIDKRAVLLGRFVGYALVLPTAFLYKYKYDIVSNNMLYFGLAFTAVPLLNSFCAYFIKGKLKRI